MALECEECVDQQTHYQNYKREISRWGVVYLESFHVLSVYIELSLY